MHRFILSALALGSLTACEAMRPYAAAPAPVVAIAVPQSAAVNKTLLFPSCMVGGDFSGHETAKAVAKGLMLRAEKCAFDHACLQSVMRGITLVRIFL